MTELKCEPERDRGIMNGLSVIGAEAKAKTVTNKCPLLTVLGEVAVITIIVIGAGFITGAGDKSRYLEGTETILSR